MTLSGIISAIVALGSIAGAVVYVLKFFKKSPTEKLEDKQEDRRDERTETEQTGRPQW